MTLLLLSACTTPPPARPPARPPDRALLAAAAVADVRSGAAPNCLATGSAVNLGGGLFVTAAHVVDGSVQRLRGGCPGAPAITLTVGGTALPARLLRAGQDRVDPGIGQRYLGGQDVAVLRPERAPPVRGTAQLCAGPAAPGSPALLVTPSRALRTRILGEMRDADPAFGAYLEIPETLQPGESGGAVFAAESGCLIGLVSHRDSSSPRTRLVPAAGIALLVAGLALPEPPALIERR